MKVHILGNLFYHNKTILEPIKKQFKIRGVEVLDFYNYGIENKVDYEKTNREIINFFLTKLPSLDLNSDVILFADFYNFSIPLVKHYLVENNVNCKLYAIHHGCVAIPGDFSNKQMYSVKMQEAIYHSLDGIFVGSKYANDHMVECYGNNYKTHITYLPIEHLNSIGYTPITDKTVLFGHRLTYDKGADILFTLYHNVIKPEGFKLIICIFTDDYDKELLDMFEKTGAEIKWCENREVYKKKLLRASCSISCARQETFGYTMLESLKAHKRILLNDLPVYREIYGNQYIYKNEDDLRRLLNSEPVDINYIDKVLEKIGGAEKKIVDIIIDENLPE